jgi:hypothetical protein
MVVPTLLPKMMPKLFLNDSAPALTKLMLITDVAELDWMNMVTTAPITTPHTGYLVAELSDLRNRSQDMRSISLEKFSNPNTNKTIAVNPVSSSWNSSKYSPVKRANQTADIHQ